MSTPWVERSSRVSSALPDDTKTLEPLSNSHYGRIAVPIRGAATRGAQGDEGAPDAWLDLDAQYREGLRDLKAGDGILVLTWLDRARRDVADSLVSAEISNGSCIDHLPRSRSFLTVVQMPSSTATQCAWRTHKNSA